MNLITRALTRTTSLITETRRQHKADYRTVKLPHARLVGINLLRGAPGGAAVVSLEFTGTVKLVDYRAGEFDALRTRVHRDMVVQIGGVQISRATGLYLSQWRGTDARFDVVVDYALDDTQAPSELLGASLRLGNGRLVLPAAEPVTSLS